MYARLKQKIIQTKASIGVIGLGYVGLPLAILCAEKGFKVTGFMRDARKIANLNEGISEIESVTKKEITQAVHTGNFRARLIDSDELNEQDVYIICVPTPVNNQKKPDITAITSVARRLAATQLDGKLIINESTVAPGMTRAQFGSLGGRYFLACSPERVDPGNKSKSVGTISKIVGGLDRESLSLAKALYENILDATTIEVSSLETAEMVKMLENTYRAVNIALVNEFARLAEKAGLDVIEIIEAAKTKWSYQAHYPGVGVGGHCIPVDPWYLVDFANQRHVQLPLIEQSLRDNDNMAQFVAEKVLSHYKKGMTVLLYGVTYKKDVKDIRESPVERLGHILQKHKVSFTVYDPFLTSDEIKALGFVPGDIKKTDMFIVGTDHSQLVRDHTKIITKETVVVDCRNFFPTKVGRVVLGVGRKLL